MEALQRLSSAREVNAQDPGRVKLLSVHLSARCLIQGLEYWPHDPVPGGLVFVRLDTAGLLNDVFIPAICINSETLPTTVRNRTAGKATYCAIIPSGCSIQGNAALSVRLSHTEAGYRVDVPLSIEGHRTSPTRRAGEQKHLQLARRDFFHFSPAVVLGGVHSVLTAWTTEEAAKAKRLVRFTIDGSIVLLTIEAPSSAAGDACLYCYWCEGRYYFARHEMMNVVNQLCGVTSCFDEFREGYLDSIVVHRTSATHKHIFENQERNEIVLTGWRFLSAELPLRLIEAVAEQAINYQCELSRSILSEEGRGY